MQIGTAILTQERNRLATECQTRGVTSGSRPNSGSVRKTRMATTYRVECINKTDRQNHYERIKNIGGSSPFRWKKSEDVAIREIETGVSEFYVDEGGRRTAVRVAQHRPTGKKYLTTHPDDTTKNNLLSLPECP